MLSTKPTKLATSSTSVFSSSETPQSSRLKLQPQSRIPSPLLSPVTYPCTPTFPTSPTPTAYPSCSALPPTPRHHLVPAPTSEALPAAPGSSLYDAQHVTEEIQTSSSVVPQVACELIPLNLLGKAITKLFNVGVLFSLFLCSFEFVLVF